MVVMYAACASVWELGATAQSRHGCCTAVLHVDARGDAQEDWWVLGYNLIPGPAHLFSVGMPV
jgi:hypothetical protein